MVRGRHHLSAAGVALAAGSSARKLGGGGLALWSSLSSELARLGNDMTDAEADSEDESGATSRVNGPTSAGSRTGAGLKRASMREAVPAGPEACGRRWTENEGVGRFLRAGFCEFGGVGREEDEDAAELGAESGRGSGAYRSSTPGRVR
jgi:hypothetical protein